MPLLPLYLEHLTATRTEIGAIMASSAIGGLALRPVVGWALDTLGRRVTLIIGTLFLVVGMLGVYLVTELGPLLYLVRVVFGVGVGTLFTGYFTYAADIIPEDRRTEGIALFGISGLVPLALSPFVTELGITGPDIRWFFPCVGVVIAFSLIPLFKLPEPQQAEASGGAPPPPMALRTTARALTLAKLAPVWLATIVFASSVSTFMTFAVVSAKARGLERPAALWLTYAIGAILVRAIGARLPDRVGPSNMIAPALGLYVVALLLAAYADTTALFAIAGLLAGLGHGYCFPVLTAQVVNRTPSHLRGSALAAFTGLWELSALALSPLIGYIADQTDDATMFASVALAGVVGLALWAAMEHRVGPTRAAL